MPVVFIRHIGANLAYIHSVEGVDPGFGVGGGVDPGYDTGIFPHPGHGLPGYGHPGNRPPGSFNPAFPDNTLPTTPPTAVAPGEVLILMRDPEGVWHYAAMAPGSPPPRPVPPGPPDHISNRPPGSGLPPHGSGQPVPPVAGQPLPPTAAPKK